MQLQHYLRMKVLLKINAMIYLIQGKYDSLNGPLGNIFIDSIRRGYSTKLGNATLEEMSEYFKDTQSNLMERMDSYRKKGFVICCGGHTEIY